MQAYECFCLFFFVYLIVPAVMSTLKHIYEPHHKKTFELSLIKFETYRIYAKIPTINAFVISNIFIYVHNLCMRAAKVLASLRIQTRHSLRFSTMRLVQVSCNGHNNAEKAHIQRKCYSQSNICYTKVLFILGQKRNAAYNTYIVNGSLSPISRKRCVTV